MNDLYRPTQNNSFLPTTGSGVQNMPMNVGAILDRVFRLMKANWRLFFGVAAVPLAIGAAAAAVVLALMFPAILQSFTPHSHSMVTVAAGPPPWLMAFLLFFYPLFLAIFALYMAAGSFAATQADHGFAISVRQAYIGISKKCGRYIWLMILCVLCVLVPTLIVVLLFGAVAAAIGLVHASPTGVYLLVPLLILFYIGILVVMVVAMLRLAVAFPACVEEDLTAWAAVRRSFLLTRSGMGRIFLVMLAIYALSYAAILVGVLLVMIIVAIGAAAGFAMHLAPGSAAFYILISLGIILYAALIFVYSVITYSAITTAIAVIYHDQKHRLEGSFPAPTSA